MWLGGQPMHRECYEEYGRELEMLEAHAVELQDRYNEYYEDNVSE
jgi:hypothetical protein